MNVTVPFPGYQAMLDNASDADVNGRSSERLPLTIKPAALPDPHLIPPRRWLYGRMLIKGYITVLVAPGGVGKTALSVAIAQSMAIGRGIAGDWVYQRTKVLACTLEDPEDEFDRRMAASMLHHRILTSDLSGQVFVVAGRDRPLLIAGLATDGFTVCYPDKEQLIRLVRQQGIGLIVVDPFVNSHELDENNNPHINAAARAWAEIANEADCAVLLVHHTRKGAVAGDMDSSRGAGALTAASRVSLTLSAMTSDEAKGFGISDKDRRLHIRLDDAKANLAPPADKARWFKLASVHLGNGEPNTPWFEGDNVQAVEVWEPPAVFTHTAAELNAALDAIGDGPSPGQRWTQRKSGAGGGMRWCGIPIMRTLSIEEGPAGKMLAVWIKEGLLVEGPYRDPQSRKDVNGITVTDSKRPA